MNRSLFGRKWQCCCLYKSGWNDTIFQRFHEFIEWRLLLQFRPTSFKPHWRAPHTAQTELRSQRFKAFSQSFAVCSATVSCQSNFVVDRYRRRHINDDRSRLRSDCIRSHKCCAPAEQKYSTISNKFAKRVNSFFSFRISSHYYYYCCCYNLCCYCFYCCCHEVGAAFSWPLCGEGISASHLPFVTSAPPL